MKTYQSVLLAACGIAYSFSAHASDLTAEIIDERAKQAIEAFSITGMSITVVTSDSVILQKSYGVRDVTKPGKVDKDTLFPFASIGKAFTTTALAMLVDEGKMNWDDPVRKYIPEFEMSDPFITAEFSVRDLVTHRSGLPLGAGDLLFVPDGNPKVEDVLAVFKNIKPTSSFRSKFAYDNLMYIVAGDVLARIDGQSWDTSIHKRIFKPLKMNSCEALPSKAITSRNTITQHTRELGGVTATPIDPRFIDADGSAPAGGISCSIKDLSKWAQFWLRGGKTTHGKALLSEQQAKELWTGVTPTPVGVDIAEHANAHFSLYGLGWSLSDFYGERMVSHGGGLLGAVSHFALLPDQDVAVFFTTNDFIPYISGLAKQILSDAISPEPSTDWIENAAVRYRSYLEISKEDNGQQNDETTTATVEPSKPLESYMGTFTDPWYGDVRIDIRDGQLFIDMSRSEVLDGVLLPVDDDKFVARWPNRTLNADAYVIFSDEDDKVNGFTMQAVSKTTDFSFDFHDLNFSKTSQ